MKLDKVWLSCLDLWSLIGAQLLFQLVHADPLHGVTKPVLTCLALHSQNSVPVSCAIVCLSYSLPASLHIDTAAGHAEYLVQRELYLLGSHLFQGLLKFAKADSACRVGISAIIMRVRKAVQLSMDTQLCGCLQNVVASGIKPLTCGLP